MTSRKWGRRFTLLSQYVCCFNFNVTEGGKGVIKSPNLSDIIHKCSLKELLRHSACLPACLVKVGVMKPTGIKANVKHFILIYCQGIIVILY